MNYKLLLIVLAVCVITVLVQSSAFSFNSGNLYYEQFTKNPSANSLSCNFSPAFYPLNIIWKVFEQVGLTFQQYWLALSLLIAIIGVFLQYKWVKLASGDDKLALAAAGLSFILMDLWAPASLPAPRHLVFFILMPLAYYYFFKARKEPAQGFTPKIVFAVLTAAIIALHVLFAAFFLLSIAFFYVGLALSHKPFLPEAKKTALALLIAFVFASPFLYQGLILKNSTTPSYSYSNFDDWGTTHLGLWTPSLTKTFYAPGQTIFLGILIILSLYTVSWALTGKHRNSDFEVFVAANVFFALIIFATPLATPFAMLFSPGVFVEQFLKLVPFYLAIPLALIHFSKSKISKHYLSNNLRKMVLLGLSLAVLAYPAYFYYQTSIHPAPSPQEFLGFSPQDLQTNGGAVLSDFYTSYDISSLSGAKTIAVNPGYNVCLSKENLQGITDSNKLYSGTLSPQEAKAILARDNISVIVLNPRFWQWHLNSKTSASGFEYPPSFKEAKSIFENYGLGEVVDNDTVIFKS